MAILQMIKKKSVFLLPLCIAVKKTLICYNFRAQLYKSELKLYEEIIDNYNLHLKPK